MLATVVKKLLENDQNKNKDEQRSTKIKTFMSLQNCSSDNSGQMFFNLTKKLGT